MKKLFGLMSLFLIIVNQSYPHAYQNPRTQVLHYKKNKITIMFHDSNDKKVTWGKKCSIKGDKLRCPYKGKACKGTPHPYTMQLAVKDETFVPMNNLIKVADGIIVSLFVLEPNTKDVPPTTCYTPYYSVASDL